MEKALRVYNVLMADDDAEDCLLVRDAMQEACQPCRLHYVRDGEELFDFLRREGEYADPRVAPRPDLILLDLKMPRMDGRDVLRRLRTDPQFRRIPVVVLTTSTAEEDVHFAYDLGVCSYIAKPVTFRALVDIMKVIGGYWFGLVRLPADR